MQKVFGNSAAGQGNEIFQRLRRRLKNQGILRKQHRQQHPRQKEAPLFPSQGFRLQKRQQKAGQAQRQKIKHIAGKIVYQSIAQVRQEPAAVGAPVQRPQIQG